MSHRIELVCKGGRAKQNTACNVSYWFVLFVKLRQYCKLGFSEMRTLYQLASIDFQSNEKNIGILF
jgi:hypothetical protein